MPGILVIGNNHFIVRGPIVLPGLPFVPQGEQVQPGPVPDRTTALALARHWSLIQIGQSTPIALQQWSISTREFREDLEWAVVVPGEGEISPAVAQLLEELSARGITIHNSDAGDW
jgi:hypothetical protein